MWKNNLVDSFMHLSLHPRLRNQKHDSVAQLVEHYTFNVGVLGSNPSGITVIKFFFLIALGFVSRFTGASLLRSSPSGITQFDQSLYL